MIEDCKVVRIDPSKEVLKYHRHLESGSSDSDHSSKMQKSERGSTMTRPETDRPPRVSLRRQAGLYANSLRPGWHAEN